MSSGEAYTLYLMPATGNSTAPGAYRPPRRRRPSSSSGSSGSSSINSILGGRGVAQTQRQTAPPSGSRSSIPAGAYAGTGSSSTTRSALGRDSTIASLLRVGVPSSVPQQYRAAVALQGQRLNDALEEAGLDMTGPEYLAKLIEFESGWSPTAENPSSAYGLGQFIDSTAEDFRSRLGVETQDPSRPKQMIKGASMHASGKFGYGGLYAGYNPGYGSDPVPGTDAGENVSVGVNRKKAQRLAGGAVQSSGGAPQQLWQGKGKERITGDTGGITQDVKGLGKRIAALSGEPINVISGARPGATTTTGNTSDHSSGNALDIDAHSKADGGSEEDQARGDRIAIAALVAAGMPRKEAEAKVQPGQDSMVDDNIDYTGDNYRVQVIWKTPAYGGHENHVHVGIRGDSSNSGSAPVSGGAAVSGGLTAALGGTARPGGAAAQQQAPQMSPFQGTSPMTARATPATGVGDILAGLQGEGEEGSLLEQILSGKKRYRPRR